MGANHLHYLSLLVLQSISLGVEPQPILMKHLAVVDEIEL